MADWKIKEQVIDDATSGLRIAFESGVSGSPKLSITHGANGTIFWFAGDGSLFKIVPVRPGAPHQPNAASAVEVPQQAVDAPRDI